MEDDKLTEHLIDIKEKIGKIDGKLIAVCQRLEHLPCDRHRTEYEYSLKEKVPWKVFVIALAAFFSVIGTAFLFTYEVEQELHVHTGDRTAHVQINPLPNNNQNDIF